MNCPPHLGLYCPRCDRLVHDVSELHLARARETNRGRRADAVYLCGRTCGYAWLLVGGELEPVERRWVEGLETWEPGL